MSIYYTNAAHECIAVASPEIFLTY